MKITSTLHEILQAELINSGFNEFVQERGMKLSFSDSEYSFLYKMRNNDEDIYNISNRIIFLDKTLENPEDDKDFKQLFLNRFLARQIGFQTLERFSMAVISVFMENEKYLNTVYSDLQSYVDGIEESESTSLNDSVDISKNSNNYRNAVTTLPQSEVNLDVDNTILDYADNNTISKQTEVGENTTTGTNTENSKRTRRSIDELKKSRRLIAEVFDEFDRRCFLHVW